ncbi:MAG: chitobiase/beta-hexosaminidase C-terminal domain-containing protein [Lachnospiraceae bacterium]|nr:chitobiase/beta-hexosaminidase C-terminal domain-containing protein [Lachnospiraceae bacterium]
MKCPNCGAEMKDGLLYCEHCGEDIHIVPDFEPEIEYNLEQTLNDIVKEIRGPEEEIFSEEEISTEDISTEDISVEEIPEQVLDEVIQDWDEHKDKKHRRKKPILLHWILGIVIVVAIIGSAVGLAYYRYHSPEYQIGRAEACTVTQEYDRAISYYSRALELTPGSIELKFALAEVYFLKNNKIEYEYLLREIVKDKNATMEQLESAYGKLIAIYRAREDFDTINDLLLASNNESIKSIYQSYLAIEPEFSIKEGYYTSIQPLKLTTFGTGKIYYTTDGSDPNENSQLYTAPILLEDGDYCIKAVYINENNISSEIVTQKYHIEIEKLPSPEISVVGGDYEFPINIEVISEEPETVYYTTNGKDPTEHSTLYTGPIPMPLGASTFKFIRIEDGKSSEVVERSYNLKMNTTLTPNEAISLVFNYALESGRILDAEGHFDDTGYTYRYDYQYVKNINKVDDFFVITESVLDLDKAASRTGNDYAVNAYSREIFRLHRDEKNNYVLVEIEKVAHEE